MRNWKKYRALSHKERSLFREALRRIYWAKINLLLFRFRRISSNYESTGEIRTIDKDKVLEIKRAIFRANKLILWKHTCLVNTLAARRMLNKRNIHSTAHLGARKKQELFAAHAWLNVGAIEIIPKEEDFTELHTF